MSSTPPPTYDTRSSLKPFLELPHLLSLTWLAYPILSLLFVAFRLQLSLDSAQGDIASAKADLVASCQAAQKAATAAASLPRYMAIATNAQFVDAVNDSMNAARATLVLSLTIMETIINFIIDIYRSTLLCFVELVVRGALSLAISAVAELNAAVQDVASGLASGIQGSISDANSAISSAINTINKVNPFGNISVPTIPSPDLSALNNVSLPSSFNSSLSQLNASLPTFSQLKADIDAVIDTPFELLKKDINDTFAGLNFNSSLLTVPELNELTFCDQLDTSVVDDLGQDLVKVAKIGVIILILLALILVGLNCALEWYKWRCQNNHLRNIREAWTTDPAVSVTHTNFKGAGAPSVTLTDYNLLVLQANSAHPLITRIINQLSTRLHFGPTTHINLSWFLHYIFHPPALACFLIGFFGLLSVELQLLAVHPLEAKFSAQAAATSSSFANTIVTSVNASMYNQSATYANNVNTHIDVLQSSINDGLFGWVNGTTTALNNTIATFYSDIQDAISDAFNGTLLEQPLQEFLACFIGSKVESIEEALTFLNQNLQIDMPRVNESILVLSPEAVNEATQPISQAAVGSGSPGDSGFVGKLVNAYVASLEKERLMFGVFMALWGVVVLMGLGILLWNVYGRGWVERRVERRRRGRWEREQRGGVDGLIVPFRDAQPVSEKPGADFLSFSPEPEGYKIERATSGSSKGSRTPLTGSESKTGFSLFGKGKKPFPVISKPFKLMSVVGPKTQGDAEAEAGDLSTEDRDASAAKPWFGRFTGAFGKKGSGEEDSPTSSPSPPYPSYPSNYPTSTYPTYPTSDRTRPHLEISIDRASSVDANENANEIDVSNVPHSRWSTSPEVTKIAPWMGMLSPTRRSYDHGPPPASSSSSPSSKPTSSLLKPTTTTTKPTTSTPARSHPAVPAGVDSMYEIEPTPFATPLHLGFNGVSLSNSNPNSNSNSPSNSNSKSLAPPRDPFRDPHRRLPPAAPAPSLAPAFPKQAPSGTSGTSITSITPVTRYLTTTPARRSSNTNYNTNYNPFATPFDDEHRVTLQQSPPHQSYQTNLTSAGATNPFMVVAM
ncbi:hypothetical protein BDP27DRAFT_1452327 [Rhodocollybia butyracea]|uniref:Plasma membrane fusion protein PRM1 n=1 Tax=Rhodocollybia butyracea TaxID=206335 RepID=A0A9P5U175_9AGAR|nr:hypothetical protein BDP27DRAFT_1452327 [Rhodocollybia butyracea]